MRNLLIAIILSTCFSCSEKKSNSNSIVSEYIKSEIKRLNQAKPMVTKFSMINGKTDTLHTDSIDWTRELNVFLANDISENRLGEYTIDSLKYMYALTPQPFYADWADPVEMMKITYTANDSNEKIKSLKIVFPVKQPDEKYVEIIVQKQHELYNYYKNLSYSRKRGYRITGSQDMRFIDKMDYEVDVRFDKKFYNAIF